MPNFIERRRDFYAGALMALIGVAAIAIGRQYGVGALTAMKPGFFPVAVGALLVVVGIAIAVTGGRGEEIDLGHTAMPRWDWRGGCCILAGTICFIVLGQFFGLVPATIGCVFVAAMGDRKMAVARAAVLAVAIAGLGVILFHYQLKIPFALFRWGV
jgi:hypothetical protein